MALNRGIVTERKSTSARAIEIKSTIPIAVVATGAVQEMKSFDSVTDALEYFTANSEIKRYLEFGDRKYRLSVPLIVSVAEIGANENETKANIINALTELAKAPSVFSVRPDVVGCVETKDVDIANALIAVCNKLKARGFVSLEATSNSEAITRRNAFGTDRITPIFCNLKDFNPKTAMMEEYDSSIVMALLRSATDGSNAIGYSYSISNRVLEVNSPVTHREFLAGMQDETDTLTDNQITSFINYKGLRTWNYKTTDIDPIWQDARRVRIFDLASFAVLDGIFYAVDRDISALESAKDSLRAFMASLVGAEVMLGFNVRLDLARTTPTAISQNKFYFIIECQETPSPELISVTFNRVDSYSSVVYKRLEA